MNEAVGAFLSDSGATPDASTKVASEQGVSAWETFGRDHHASTPLTNAAVRSMMQLVNDGRMRQRG